LTICCLGSAGRPFFAFYHDCTVRHLRGKTAVDTSVLDVEELEAAYAQHLDEIIADHGTLDQWRFEEIRCGPGVDPGKLASLCPQVRRDGLRPSASRLNARFTVVSKYKSLEPSPQEKRIRKPTSPCRARSPSVWRNQPAPRSLSLAHPFRLLANQARSSWATMGSPLPREAASERDYESLLRSLRRQAVDRLKPSLLNANLGNLDRHPATVSELAQFRGRRASPGCVSPLSFPPRRTSMNPGRGPGLCSRSHRGTGSAHSHEAYPAGVRVGRGPGPFFGRNSAR